MRAGVDIGGTFTDLCIAGPDGIVTIGKALSTPSAPADSVETVLRDALEREAYALSQVVHATTLVTNALIERKGAKVALLATAGFRDVMELARERRPDIYRLDVWRPEPLVPRHLRFDVKERTLADGEIEQPVDEQEVGALAEELAERGIEAIAICFLHSYMNPANEQNGESRGGACGAAAARRDLQRRRARDPRVRAHADHGRERLRAGSRGALPRRPRGAAQLAGRARSPAGDAFQRRRGHREGRGRATDPDARVRPRRRCARRGPLRRAERVQGPDVLRHGWHDRQAVLDRGRTSARHPRVRGCAHRPLHARLGTADQDADDRHDRDRRRRRVAGPRRHARVARLRAGVRGRRPWACVLRRRGNASHRHGRRPRPRLSRSRLLPRRRDDPRRRGGENRDPHPHRRAARPHRRAGGMGHPPSRQRGHGQRRARSRGRARPRRDRPPAVRLRRRRPGARVRRRGLARDDDRDRPRRGGRHEQRRRARRSVGHRRRAQPPRAGRRRDAVARGAAVRRTRAGGRRDPRRFRSRRRAHPPRALDRHALRRPGLRSDRPRDPGRGPQARLRGGVRPRPRPQRPGRPDRGHQLARAHPRAGPRSAARRRARPAIGDARKGTRDVYFDDGFLDTPIYDRYRMGPGTRIDGPAIVEERESTSVVGPGATARVAEDGSLIIEVAP